MTLSQQLSWSHFHALLPIKDPLARDFYAEMCRIERWNVRTLRLKIGGMLFQRTALSKRPPTTGKAVPSAGRIHVLMPVWWWPPSVRVRHRVDVPRPPSELLLMTNLSRRGYQFARPVLVASQDADALVRPLIRWQLTPGGVDASTKFSERWLQHLIHRHPQVLPIEELESAFGRLIPVAMELATPSGYVDNVFVTPEGQLVLVECKLWRNPEARRKVLAQIIDYAQGMTSWRYQDLDRAIGESMGLAGKPVAKTLMEIVRADAPDADEIDEASFIDAIQRNLRLGRMLLLVVGDGIREDTESLVDFVHRHAGFHFTLGLVEAAIYELPDKQLLVQPRILARTLNIERAVITIVDGAAIVTPSLDSDDASAKPRGSTLSEEAYFEQLGASSPATCAALKEFITIASDSGVSLDVATKSGSLKWQSPKGRLYNLCGIDVQGRLVTYSVCWGPDGIGRADLAHAYLSNLAGLIKAQVRETKKPSQWYLVSFGTTVPPAQGLLAKPAEWIAKIEAYKASLIEAEDRV